MDKAQENNDVELIRRIAFFQDKQAFKTLSQNYMQMVFAVAYRMGFNLYDAEDIVQETMVRVWQKADTWKERKDASVKSWIGRIAYNQCLDRKRKIKRTFEDTGMDYEQLHQTQENSEDDVRNKQKRKIVGNALLQLPENQRIAVVLCHYHGFTNAEAAKSVGISTKVLESLLVRGRKTLRIVLGEHRQELLS